MALFIAYPWLALVVSAAFAALWWWRRAASAAAVGAAWLAYSAYEFLMRARVLCSGECNIRVDLLLIYPLLLAASLLAAWRSFRRAVQERQPSATGQGKR